MAVTSVSASTVTQQGSVPEQPPPDQPAKAVPGAGSGVRFTRVPGSKAYEQLPGQSIPDGELVTDPDPSRQWRRSAAPLAAP